MTWRFEAEVWEWTARASWYFVTLPDDVSDAVDAATAGAANGFGSVRVRVTVGTTTWSTSVFPDSTRGAYVLPLKKAVRIAQGLDVGAKATFAVDLEG